MVKRTLVVIVAALTGTASARAQSRPTFSEHVAPILQRQCASCHQPGGSAPFSLLTYADARERAALIAAAVESRRMPPWLPEPGYAEFAGERRLTDAEIATIRRWVNGGVIEGRAAVTSAPPSKPELWQLGEPDLVIAFPAYDVPGEGSDIYRNLVVEYPGADVRYVRAVELLPGQPQVVHHARLMVDTTRSSREMDRQDPAPGFDGMDVQSHALNPDGFFVGWTPGKVPRAGDDGLAWRIAPGTDFVLQVHLRPNGLA
ncbi:MAG: tetratricopeptide repeat protein, partial [Gemmatimonadales bacterium]